MMRVRRLFIFLLVSVSIVVCGQYTKEFKRIFFNAEYLYQTGFYEEAFNRYKNLLTIDQGNSNILFHCGACCLNIPGSEDVAITYLKEAVSGVTNSYKERSHKESRAPVLTYFMLGRAYHLHNEFDMAIQNYELYQSTGVDEDPMQLEYAGLQIEASRRAAEVVGNAPSFEFQSVLDQFDDDLPSCNNPVISGDGNILIFLVDYASDNRIMMTTRSGSLWSRPRVINNEIGMVGETYPVCLSYDGNDLYLVHQFYSHSDIFVSSFEGSRWSIAEALGPNVNGRTSETHASVSKDGQTLYFTSDTRGGYGSFDIFVSRRGNGGAWGPAKNLGPVINTPYEEHTPFISSNDSILFFSSQGHASIGGIDVYYSELTESGFWGEPVNLGYPVNTTGEDLFFNPGWDEIEGYYAVRRESDPTSNTIKMVIELEPEEAAVVSEHVDPRTADSEYVDPEHVAVAIETDETLPVIMPSGLEEVATLAMEIEPPETDQIEEVLNRSVKDEVMTPPSLTPTSKEILTGIPFDYNEFHLSFAAVLEVERIADLMLQFGDTRIELTGHADASGSSDYNMLLSLQRADQIAQYLLDKGMNTDRISIIGKGELAPIARNHYPDGTIAPLGRYLNRYVVVNITGLVPAEVGLSGLYVPDNLLPDISQTGQGDSQSYSFTIQIVATRRPADLSLFPGLDDITEYICKDGYYRYTFRAFNSFRQAKVKLGELHNMGYGDVFIQTTEWYRSACE